MKTKFHHARKDRTPDFGPFRDGWVNCAMAQGQISRHGASGCYTNAILAQAVTICKIVDEEGVLLSTGYAFCSPQDNFSRKTGRRIAEGRARIQLQKN